MKVEVGDILEEMDSIPLHGQSPDAIAKMVKRAGGRVPIRYTISFSQKRIHEDLQITL
jgi:hypothetical protein